MATVLNSRAKLPTDLASLQKQFNINHKTLLSTNPKTEKSQVQTYILHLAPDNTSGVNVCPGAGNCRKICLHFAGNPVYMDNKQAARIRRTLAFSANKQRFARLLVCAILDKMTKHNGEHLAIRLNGTSDIAWENVDFDILPEFASFCRTKFGYLLPIGKRNIFEIFNILSLTYGRKITFYDYTKIRRNWAECKRLGYHLTFSFDGWDNAQNLKICRDALLNRVNVAAAFNVKRGQSLPDEIDAARLNLPFSATFTGGVLPVLDGDLTDFRPDDLDIGTIVGLRFKLPHGIKYTEQEKMAFCLQ